MVATRSSTRPRVPPSAHRVRRTRNSLRAAALLPPGGRVNASSRSGARTLAPRSREAPTPTFLDLEDPALQRAVNVGIKAEAALHGLQELVDLEGDIRFKMKVTRTVRNSPRRNKNNDDGFFGPFWKYCAETGNYSSMIMLLFDKPRDPQLPGRVPAMEPEAIAGYLRYMTKDTHVILRNGDQGDSPPIVHVLRRTHIMCTHTWRQSNTPMKTFVSLLKKLHAKHRHNDPYERRCPHCTGKKGACGACHPVARLSGKGNPVSTAVVQTALKAFYRSYQSRVCSMLYPREVRTLRDHLLSPGQTLPKFIANLGVYVLVLVSITQILWSDETLCLTFESFDCQRNFFIEDEDGVLQALAHFFMGKSGESTVYQYVNADHQHPDLDPVRHLLLYVYLIQKLLGNPEPSGFLFMPTAHLIEPLLIPQDGCFRESICEAGLRKTLRKLLMTVLGLVVSSVEKGLRMFCQTGYAFRMLALGFAAGATTPSHVAWTIIKNDVCHISDADAMNYIQRAWHTTRLLVTFDIPRNRVSQAKPIRFPATRLQAETLSKSRIKGWTLNKVATDYVERHLPPGGYRDHYTTFQSLFELKQSSVATSQPRHPVVARQEAQCGLPTHAVRTTPNHRHHPAVAVAGAVEFTADVETEPHAGAATEMDAHQLVRAPGKRKYRENDLVIRRRFTGKPINEVVGMLREVAQIRSSLRPNELTSAAKKWLSEGYTPAMECLKNHHANRDESFSKRWAGFEWSSTFKKRRCCGKPGTPCGVESMKHENR